MRPLNGRTVELNALLNAGSGTRSLSYTSGLLNEHLAKWLLINIAGLSVHSCIRPWHLLNSQTWNESMRMKLIRKLNWKFASRRLLKKWNVRGVGKSEQIPNICQIAFPSENAQKMPEWEPRFSFYHNHLLI